MNNNKFNDSTPIIHLTVEQLKMVYQEAKDNQDVQVDNNDKWLSIRTCAEYANCGESTIRKHLSKIKSARIGNKILIKRSDFDEFLRSHSL